MKLGLELKKLVLKFQVVLKVYTKCRLNFHNMECTRVQYEGILILWEYIIYIMQLTSSKRINELAIWTQILCPSLIKIKKSTSKKYLILKHFLYIWKWNFLASYFSYISGGNFPSTKNKKNTLWKNFLYLGKLNFSLKIFLYFRRDFQSLKSK